MLIGMIGSWWKRPRNEVGRVSVMPPWSIWLGALVLLVVAAVSMWTLFGLFGAGSPQDKIRLEIVKLAGSIVVGTGGAVALLLAARRQRATELQLAQNERDLAQKERAAADARHDAAERRITELYSSAAEQLGSDKAPVRLAALHALERLGQDNPGHRQTVVDLMCAYLRMRDTSSDDQEGQVRLTAQRLLTAHLRPQARGDGKFWAGIDLDLTRATLVAWDMAGCSVRSALFDGADFRDDAAFRQTEFGGAVSFRDARFHGAASFDRARFRDAAGFGAAVALGEISFRAAEFDGAVSFGGADFLDRTSFSGGRFGAAGSFRQVVFRGGVSFREAQFREAASFAAAEFRDEASFGGATFHGSASFGEARFHGAASFREAEFHGAAWFDQAQLGEPDFSGARMLTPDPATAQGWRQPGWRLTAVDGEVPDEQQRRWFRFAPAD
ncbi:pentapeptide repeat-containing protein [Saccharopolyspora hirsuta]|nr:pentapeptide repeat-containing protein [Saccharopolyspora hirsuta]